MLCNLGININEHLNLGTHDHTVMHALFDIRTTFSLDSDVDQVNFACEIVLHILDYQIVRKFQILRDAGYDFRAKVRGVNSLAETVRELRERALALKSWLPPLLSMQHEESQTYSSKQNSRWFGRVEQMTDQCERVIDMLSYILNEIECLSQPIDSRITLDSQQMCKQLSFEKPDKNTQTIFFDQPRANVGLQLARGFSTLLFAKAQDHSGGASTEELD